MANQQDAYYNLGNALYRTGQKTEQTDPQETLQKWTEAVKAYETALQLRADDADSKYNRDLVKRKIEALQQKQDQHRNPPQNQGHPAEQGTGPAAIAAAGQGGLQGGSAAAVTPASRRAPAGRRASAQGAIAPPRRRCAGCG